MNFCVDDSGPFCLRDDKKLQNMTELLVLFRKKEYTKGALLIAPRRDGYAATKGITNFKQPQKCIKN